MKKDKSEDIYGQIAKEYVDYTGEKLRLESQTLPPHSEAALNRLDTRVAGRMRTLKNRRFIRLAGGLAAACLLLVIAIPIMYQLKNPGDINSSDLSSESTEAESPSVKLIPLSFTLPDNLTVTDSKVDNGASIYYLSDSFADDVVLRMEYSDNAEMVFDSLKPIKIEGNEAYGISTDSYKMLSFVHDEILYTLTCKYDINTLIAVSKHIF